jgi:hypothetical protein
MEKTHAEGWNLNQGMPLMFAAQQSGLASKTEFRSGE